VPAAAPTEGRLPVVGTRNSAEAPGRSPPQGNGTPRLPAWPTGGSVVRCDGLWQSVRLRLPCVLVGLLRRVLIRRVRGSRVVAWVRS
jgi:hypothetical protein